LIIVTCKAAAQPRVAAFHFSLTCDSIEYFLKIGISSKRGTDIASTPPSFVRLKKFFKKLFVIWNPLKFVALEKTISYFVSGR